MQDDFRREVRDMVNAMMADALTPVRQAQSELRERLIGIDGNGTGRVGALQRQDAKMEAMDNKITKVEAGVATLVNRSQSWNKKNVWALAKWVVGGICALGLMLLAHWIDHHYGGTP